MSLLLVWTVHSGHLLENPKVRANWTNLERNSRQTDLAVKDANNTEKGSDLYCNQNSNTDGFSDWTVQTWTKQGAYVQIHSYNTNLQILPNPNDFKILFNYRILKPLIFLWWGPQNHWRPWGVEGCQRQLRPGNICQLDYEIYFWFLVIFPPFWSPCRFCVLAHLDL